MGKGSDETKQEMVAKDENPDESSESKPEKDGSEQNKDKELNELEGDKPDDYDTNEKVPSSFCLSEHLSGCLSPSHHSSVHLPVWLSQCISPFICPSASLAVSVHLTIHLSICRSGCLSPSDGL